ncbi:MAG: hypothetical protein U1E06_08385 [Tabrizicola sp.]|nr:hypothetical protein [Tabrizicola sp.]
MLADGGDGEGGVAAGQKRAGGFGAEDRAGTYAIFGYSGRGGPKT